MNLMEQPSVLWRTLALLTTLLCLALAGLMALLGLHRMGIGVMAGVLTLGGVMAFYGWLVRRFARPGNPSFQRILMLSGVVKYPLLMLAVYLVVRGGVQMAMGFAIGILLPLFGLTLLAIRANRA
jgi:hypothetical protein